MTEALMVRRETHVAAPAATVFAFLTDPEKILSWMGAEATTEPHPGGLYLVKGVGGDHARAAAGRSAKSCRSIGSPTASVGRGGRRSLQDRVSSRSI
jgi:hypothetical protein